MEIRKPYKDFKRNPSITGTPVENIYARSINNKGIKDLIVTGKKNLYEEIQGYADEVTIENIMKRVSVGDMSDFRPDGIYQDVSEIPTNFIQARQEMMKVEQLWNHLKPEVKQKYNFDLDQFMAQAGSEAWCIDAGLIKEEIKSPVLEVDMSKATAGVTDAAPAEE